MASKRIIAFITIICMVITCAACGNNKQASIKIYLTEQNANIENAISDFNEHNKNYNIQKELFYNNQQDEYKQRLKSELLAGDGPDIILMEADTIEELSKYIEKGVFLELDELMEKDGKFQLSDYNQKVLEYGGFKSKRYLIPLGYTIDAYFTTADILESSGVDLKDSVLSVEKIVNEASQYGADNVNKDKYLISPIDFTYLMNSCDNEYINMQRKKADFDSKEFLSLLEQYKGLNNLCMPKDKNGNTILNLSEVNSLKYLWAKYSSYENEVDPEAGMITSQGRRHVNSVPVMCAAINSKCENKQAAYNFIKLLLSEKYQENKDTDFLPVNLKAYETQKEVCLRGGKQYISALRGGGCKSDASIKKLVASVDNMVASIDTCRMTDYVIVAKIRDEVEQYLKGLSTSNEAAASISQWVKEYFDAPLQMEGEKEVQTEKQQSEVKLKIKMTGNFEYVNDAIRIFKAKYKNVVLEQQTVDNVNNLRETLTTELMAGTGPDIIPFNDYTFESLYKVVSSEVFADLNEIISKDEEFSLEDYFAEPLKYGVYNGKRYFIPVSFYFNILSSTEKCLAENGFQYNKDKWTWGSFTQIGEAISGKGEKMYLIEGNLKFSTLLASSGESFIDYANRKSHFSSPEFVKLLEIYKKISLYKGSKNYGNITEEGSFFNSHIFAINGSYGSWYNMFGLYSYLKKIEGEDLKLLPMPSLKEGNTGVTITPFDLVAINAKSKNKQEAFNFLKLLLSVELQKQVSDNGLMNNILAQPVNKMAFEEDKKLFSSSSADEISLYLGGRSFNGTHMPENVISEIDSFSTNMKTGDLYDLAVKSIINEQVDDFIKGKKTAEKTASEIHDKVTLLLNE